MKEITKIHDLRGERTLLVDGKGLWLNNSRDYSHEKVATGGAVNNLIDRVHAAGGLQAVITVMTEIKKTGCPIPEWVLSDERVIMFADGGGRAESYSARRGSDGALFNFTGIGRYGNAYRGATHTKSQIGQAIW